MGADGMIRVAQPPGHLFGRSGRCIYGQHFHFHHEHSFLLLEGIIGFWLVTLYHLRRLHPGLRHVR